MTHNWFIFKKPTRRLGASFFFDTHSNNFYFHTFFNDFELTSNDLTDLTLLKWPSLDPLYNHSPGLRSGPSTETLMSFQNPSQSDWVWDSNSQSETDNLKTSLYLFDEYMLALWNLTTQESVPPILELHYHLQNYWYPTS